MKKRPCLLLFSGGQDSMTLLYWAQKEFSSVECLTINYGQRHNVELQQARALCEKENIPHKCIEGDFFSQLNQDALTNESSDIVREGPYQNLPSTFVPGRNIFFLSMAAAFAAPRGISDLIIGACQTDYSGYPDCRENFIQSMEKSLSFGMNFDLKIHTPLMHLNKAETFKMAYDLGHLDDVLENSHTCYKGQRKQRHPWGYGCAECPACELRSKGFESFEKLYL